MARCAVFAVALLLLSPGSAPAAAARYTVERPFASLRNAPAAFVLGHVFAGDGLDVVARRPGWVYARSRGRCGWVMRHGLRRTGRRTTATCPPPRTLAPRRLFAPGTYTLGCGEGCVQPARVVPCDDRTAYANYDPPTGAFTDPYGRERAGRGTRGPTVARYAGVRSGYAGFGVRYVSADGAATLIKDTRRRHGGPAWLFMRAECVERLALTVTGRSIGAFAVGRRPRAAPRAFGRLAQRRRIGTACRLTWPRLGLTLDFARCRRLTEATIARRPVSGSALVHRWTTTAGLRLGDRVRVLRRLYPGARRRHGAFVLEPHLRAVAGGGRVQRFRVTR